MKYLTIIFMYLILNTSLGQSSQTSQTEFSIKAIGKKASLRSGDNFWEDAWTISPDQSPDIWYVNPNEKGSIIATFITDLDSISVEIEKGEIFEFNVILDNGEVALTQIKGAEVKARFSQEYQDKNKGRTLIEVPKVYELFNVVFALTRFYSDEETQVIEIGTSYYAEVMDWFEDYREHQCVLTVDSILRENSSMYFILKMDSYVFDVKDGKIKSKGIYNRIAQDVGDIFIPNSLLQKYEDFYTQSNFENFYDGHQDFYNSQIAHYEKNINIALMQEWLNNNFPNTSYDCFKVIFSPLVGWNQSASWFEEDGFKEAQAHVNFPYPSAKDLERNDVVNNMLDGQILFTEFNHAYINPEAEQYFNSNNFKKAFDDMSFWWVENGVAQTSYSNGPSTFNEMMNWALVCVYMADNLESENLTQYISNVENWQIEKRGFKYFKQFNQNLINLYENRQSGQTMADLYPEIIEWCLGFTLSSK